MQHTRPNTSKSGFTISERRKLSSKILNSQKSMPTIACKINSNRFVGGADKEPNVEETSAKASSESIPEVSNPLTSSPPNPSTPPSSSVEKSLEKSVQLEENSQDKQLPASGPCCFCISQTPESVGDRKVDEIIEYVHQNLEQAGKALATLGENFEHDLKLMFVDILGQIKQWSGIVQNKLDICKNEVNNLRKELLARACEIDVKTRELKDLKAQIADYESRLPNELLKDPKKNLEQKAQKAKMRENQLVAENAQAKDVTKRAIIGARTVDEEAEEIKRTEKIAKENATQYEEDEAQVVDRIEEEEEDEEDKERAVDQIINEDEKELLKRKNKNEKKLESEIKRLRKEYNRVMKERAEYENAIQRALLRGVSCLNVEALRVLRCPPLPCCIPCAPCPATAGIIPPEPVVPCPGKSRRKHPESAVAAVSSAKVSHDNTRNDDHTDCTTKRPSTSPCCSINRRRKSTDDDGMIFLLHQGDAGSLGAPDEVCDSTIMKKIKIPPLPRFGI